MENIPAENQVVPVKKNVLFEVTTLSKTLAAVLFIALPFVGFFLGYNQSSIDRANEYIPVVAPQTTIEKKVSPEASPKESMVETIKNIPTTTTVTAYIVALTDTEIVLDYMTPLTGDEAIDALIEDGHCTEAKRAECFEDRIPLYDRNKNPLLRTFKLSPDAKFVSWFEQEYTKDALNNVYPETADGYTRHYSYPQMVTINADDEVVKSVDIFRP